nr:uncharacterized protein LOC123284800 [Equus asinus]
MGTCSRASRGACTGCILGQGPSRLQAPQMSPIPGGAPLIQTAPGHLAGHRKGWAASCRPPVGHLNALFALEATGLLPSGKVASNPPLPLSLPRGWPEAWPPLQSWVVGGNWFGPAGWLTTEFQVFQADGQFQQVPGDTQPLGRRHRPFKGTASGLVDKSQAPSEPILSTAFTELYYAPGTVLRVGGQRTKTADPVWCPHHTATSHFLKCILRHSNPRGGSMEIRFFGQRSLVSVHALSLYIRTVKVLISPAAKTLVSFCFAPSFLNVFTGTPTDNLHESIRTCHWNCVWYVSESRRGDSMEGMEHRVEANITGLLATLVL